MHFDDLLHSSGEWLRGGGAEADIIISSRLRLARNLADFPFSNRAADLEQKEIEHRVRESLKHVSEPASLTYLRLSECDELDRQFLVERQLISREHAGGEGCRGVAIGPNEDVSLMVNEEDHLRMQVMHSGYSLMRCWDDVNKLDDLIEERVRYAFNDEFGYLTACPTNVGTGVRASVMLHLPALAMTKQIEKVFRALQKIQLAVRGLHGEGSQASGDFYQISNNITLGKTETEIIGNIEEVVPQIVHYERAAREELLKDSRETLHDKVSRAIGTLRSAQTISSEETMHHLSSVRMGVHLELLRDVSLETINGLFIQSQPAHLQKLEGRPLTAAERNVVRATFLRRKLAEPSDN